MIRIGMLTSGGDCQSLNATMRGVAKGLYGMYDDVEIIGFEDGYKGLIYADYRVMRREEFSGILTNRRNHSWYIETCHLRRCGHPTRTVSIKWKR